MHLVTIHAIGEIKTLDTNFFFYVSILLVFSALVPDKDGRIAIIVPLSLGTIDNHRKACIYLWKLQNQRTAPCPNPAPNPHSDGPLDAAINAYGVRLVYDKAATGTTRNTACNTRDTYDGNNNNKKKHAVKLVLRGSYRIGGSDMMHICIQSTM